MKHFNLQSDTASTTVPDYSNVADRADLLMNMSEATSVSLASPIEVVTLAAPLPTYDVDQIADYLASGFWGGSSHSFNVPTGGTISVNVTALTAPGRFFAEEALDAWSMVTGLNFSATTGAADITFDDNQAGAFSTSSHGGGNISSSTVNVSTSWISGDHYDLNTYSFQTYMHEIGHALGLGHAGNYNGSADYQTDSNGGGDNHYLNDSWQMTLMSYFSQSENTSITASYAYTATPMIADILAMQQLYGVADNLRLGATTYGENSNAGGYYDSLDLSNMAFTIIDNGGNDTIDFRSESADMDVSLKQEAISSIGGETGNMIIARGTVIENFFAGSGDDKVTGNNAKNFIKGGAGDDLIKGKGGQDYLSGNGGNDKILGGTGDDTILGGAGADVIFGGGGNDTITGGIGRDKLIGSSGADTFIFRDGDGKDKIRDFEAGIDTLQLEISAWGSSVNNIAFTTGAGYIQLESGNGEFIKLMGISDINDIAGDFVFY